MANKVTMLVGADPELFFEENGEVVSAHDRIPGTKVQPHAVDGGAIQVDGVAAEFNIIPADTAKMFTRNIAVVMSGLKKFAGEKVKFRLTPYNIFSEDYFKTLPDNVKELGCNPDFDAYSGKANSPPDAQSTMRTAAGHIHVGWCKNVDPFGSLHLEDCKTFARQLDYYLGLYSLIWDPDNTRRKMYGRAGAFRPKPYGVEYRVLSNVWLRSPRLQTWIFESVQRAAFDLMNSKKSIESQYGEYAKECINDNKIDWNNSKDGQQIILKMGMVWPDLSEMDIKKNTSRTQTWLDAVIANNKEHTLDNNF